MSFDTKRLYELLPAIYRIRDAEQGVLTTIDTTLTQYDSVKNAVANSVHNNVYQIGNQQDLLHSQDRLLLRVGDSIELAGQFTAARPSRTAESGMVKWAMRNRSTAATAQAAFSR